MDYLVVGLNHKTAPLALREKVAFAPENLTPALKALLSLDAVAEGMIVSTCNRVEIYAATSHGETSLANIRTFLSQIHQIDAQALLPHLYSYQAVMAVKHMFRVAASVDSMVVGETQIVGQIKKAFQTACDANTTGVYLNQCMSRALHVAKKVRSETALSEGIVSLGGMAGEMAKKIFGDLAAKKILLIGAGDNAHVILDYLAEAGASDITILNRHVERAKTLGQQYGAKADSLDQLWQHLSRVDIVLTSIDGNSPLITYGPMQEVMRQRKHGALFMIDLGVPRNISPAINRLNNLYLYNLDDLHQIIDKNRASRAAEANKAEIMIDVQAKEFYTKMIRHHATLRALHQKVEHIRKQEVEKVFRQMPHLTSVDKQTFEKSTEVMIKKILHDPLVLLRSDDTSERDWDVHLVIKKLFKLE